MTTTLEAHLSTTSRGERGPVPEGLSPLIGGERYRALIQSSTAIVFRADPDGTLLEGWGANEYSQPFLATYLGKGWIDAVHPGDREAMLSLWDKEEESVGHWEVDFRIRRANGKYEWAHARGVALREPDGSVREWVGTLTDIHARRVAENAIAARDERLRLAVESASLGIWDHDYTTGDTWWSETKLEVLGLPPDVPASFEVLLGCMHPDDRVKLEDHVRRAHDPAGDGRIANEFRVMRADNGEERWLSSSGRVYFDAEGIPRRIIGVVTDITEAKRAALRARSAEDRFAQFASTSSNGCICMDSRGTITFWNIAASRMFGYSESEIIGRSVETIIPEALRHAHRKGVARTAFDDVYPGRSIELVAATKGGSEIPIELSVSSWIEGEERHFGALVRDISDRKRQREHLLRLAHYDPTTGLPNRTLFWEHADARLASSKPATILLIDLDSFKDVNDTLGHHAGDTVLREMAGRLSEMADDNQIVARLGGDEFVLFVEGQEAEADVIALAGDLQHRIAEPYVIGGQVIEMNCSVGIAFAPLHGTTSEELMVHADLALYSAKVSGRNRSCVFTPELRLAAQRKLTLASELRRAYEQGEFELFYQPQVDLVSEEMTGLEALVRWRHPERGLLTPSEFLPVLKRGPQAELVGTWILRQAINEAARLHRMGHPLRMGVNLFSAQLRTSELTTTIGRLLEETALPAHLIEVEITENTILRNDATILQTLHRLRMLGVGIAFDDYGTGYASLSMLKQYPLTRLKIDRSFVQSLVEDTRDRAVVEAIVALGDKFGLGVIAEGIETEEQRALLLEMQCREGQGYLFGKPQPIAGILSRLEGPPTRGFSDRSPEVARGTRGTVRGR
ncbi:MAG: hypothetical protein JWQ89_4056 [Devosia sp.]|uniref:sensor domain-containing protein n=1 Tax=Devosia sp. TaxID=1871048 RepID=UPI00262322DF|nr:bifunctional diguanylate cyclase/phosphodiesterase [Devosia sp.]MDB5542329.1 hypothetical protein [Devosia sp.]